MYFEDYFLSKCIEIDIKKFEQVSSEILVIKLDGTQKQRPLGILVI